jgi:hypothetical protein
VFFRDGDVYLVQPVAVRRHASRSDWTFWADCHRTELVGGSLSRPATSRLLRHHLMTVIIVVSEFDGVPVGRRELA